MKLGIFAFDASKFRLQISTVHHAGQAAMVHKLACDVLSKSPSTAAGWRIQRQPQSHGEKGESHFPGFYGNIPAPHYSISPGHRDILEVCLMWKKPEKETTDSDRADRQSNASHHITHN